MTSRVRCSCGRVYDPQKHSQCPDCGAESAVESVVVAEKIKPPVPPDPGGEPPLERDRVPPMRRTLPWPVFAGAGVLLIGIVFFALHHPVPPPPPPKPNPVQVSPVPHEESSTNPNPSESTPAYSPSYSPSGSSVLGGGGNLSELIAGVGQGGTLKLRPGIYQGGAVVNRPVRIIAETQTMGGQVVIQSEGKECLSVRAKGVVVQNIQFWCKGIGDLAAISVAEGGDLEMEGCKIESTTEVGLRVTGNASIKTLGSTFTTTSGFAVLVNRQAHASFTQSSFSNARIGLGVGSAATAELHSCAFEGLGNGDNNGTIIALVGEKTQVTGDDCRFTNNTVGISVRDKASLSLTNCTFKSNASGSASAGLIVVRDAQANIRGITLVDSSPYAISVMSGASLTLEDSEVLGSQAAGLVVGERNASPAQAKVRNSRFNRNAIGIGIVAGSSAEIDDSECRENNEGIVVLERGSRLTLKKTALVSNRDYGLQVYANAEASVINSDIRNNVRGALSGVPHKASQRGSLTLEDCRMGGNQVFGVGACAQSQLILTRCSFAEDTKKNIYRENGAIIQVDTGSDVASASEDATATPQSESSPKTKSISRRTKRRPQEEDISRAIRRWVLPP